MHLHPIDLRYIHENENIFRHFVSLISLRRQGVKTFPVAFHDAIFLRLSKGLAVSVGALTTALVQIPYRGGNTLRVNSIDVQQLLTCAVRCEFVPNAQAAYR